MTGPDCAACFNPAAGGQSQRESKLPDSENRHAAPIAPADPAPRPSLSKDSKWKTALKAYSPDGQFMNSLTGAGGGALGEQDSSRSAVYSLSDRKLNS